MSFMTAQPETLAAAAGVLQTIGTTTAASSTAAAAPTTGILPPAADEVSTLLAVQFGTHAAMFQAVSAKAAVIHEQFVATLATSASSYAATEVANAVATG
ncbi:PE family protein [Mycobacterium riyadhense]|uniref:PE family protein n=1 Tax=Mycobacterium riyadhense TaxID=486698 RepID=A0A1X2BB92_9MYCO|nr:PE family protein [Mycobacterium riyadhense]MCV7144393.1 PE family protein [Mycobacterium riyadhense]ORW60549.1 PE family protein [Mycobacterium riyadhense]VTP02717.1 PE family protein [Mycobacterium riyadhense]